MPTSSRARPARSAWGGAHLSRARPWTDVERDATVIRSASLRGGHIQVPRHHRPGFRWVIHSSYASGAGCKEASGTRSFMEGHRVAGGIMENGVWANHDDGARLVRVAPSFRGVAMTVIQRLVGDEEDVLHPRLMDATVRIEGERGTRGAGGCWTSRYAACRRRRWRASSQHRQQRCRGGAGSDVSTYHALRISGDNCAVKTLGVYYQPPRGRSRTAHMALPGGTG